MEKPLVLELDETKRDVVAVVDAATQIRKIPCYLLEMILGDVLSQVQTVARAEREFALASFKEQLAKEEDPPSEEKATVKEV
jgi:hypothetical protein